MILDLFFFTSQHLSFPKGQKSRTATNNCPKGTSVPCTGPEADFKIRQTT